MKRSYACLAVVVSAMAGHLRAASWTWDGGGATDGRWSWGSGANCNWAEDSLPASANTTDILFDSAVVWDPTVLGFAAGLTIRSLTFNANADSDVNLRLTTTPAGTTANNLTFDSDAGEAALTVASGATGNYVIGSTAHGTVVLSDNLAIAHNGSGTLTLGRPITGSGYAVAKSGAGTLVLAGANTFTNGLYLNEGTVQVQGNAAIANLGGAGNKVIFGGGTLRFELPTVALNFNNMNWAVTGSGGTLVYRCADTITRTLTLSGANYKAEQNGDLLIQNLSSNSVHAIAHSLAISGAGKIVYEGNNDLEVDYSGRRIQFAGANTNWSGGFELRKGSANFTKTDALGTGSLLIGVAEGAGGAALYFNPSAASGAYTNVNNVAVRSGSGRRVLQSKADNGTCWAGVFALDGTLVYDASSSAGGDTIGGAISGAGGLHKTGTQALTLSGDNVYTGVTRVEAGNLFLDDATTLASSSGIEIGAVDGGSGAGFYVGISANAASIPITVNTGSGARTLGSAVMTSTSGNATLTSDITLNTNLTINLRSSSGTPSLRLSGDISGSGGVKLTRSSGTGDYILFSGSNTYSGDTVINIGVELRTSSPNGIGDLSRVLIASDHVSQALHLRGGNETVGSIETVSTNAFISLFNANTLTVGGNGLSTTYAGYFTESGTAGGGLTKVGAGTLTLASARTNSYTGATTVSEGTLKLVPNAVNDLLCDSGAVVLNGGALELNGARDTVGALVVTADSTLALGDGTGLLTFSGDSMAQAWTGILALTGTLGKLGPTCVRFSHANRLTADQLSRILLNGKPVHLDAEGYLIEATVGTTLMLK